MMRASVARKNSCTVVMQQSCQWQSQQQVCSNTNVRGAGSFFPTVEAEAAAMRARAWAKWKSSQLWIGKLLAVEARIREKRTWTSGAANVIQVLGVSAKALRATVQKPHSYCYVFMYQLSKFVYAINMWSS
jgi:hypothetical protein